MEINKNQQMETNCMTLNEYEEKTKKINDMLRTIVDYFNIDENHSET